MATIRRAGFGTVFELEDSKVGIGTDAATHTLQALGNIRSEAATDIGISTLSTYQGFVDKEARFTTGQIDNQSQSGSTSGEIVIDGDVTVSSATTFTSGPQHLTVTDTFTLPSGDTNSRALKPTAGSLRFNQDFATLEFYTGNNWATVNSITEMQNSPGNQDRGIFAGGYSPTDTDISFVNVSTKGDAVAFGELTTSMSFGGGCSTGTRGLFGGGRTSPANTKHNVIQYLTIASTGNTIDFGDLTDARRRVDATSSSTRGLWGSADSTPSTKNIIDYVELNTLGNALDFGDMSNAAYSRGGLSSPTRAVWFGGSDSYPTIINMEFVTIASKGNGVIFGDMTVARSNCAGGGFSNGVRGVIAGGYGKGPGFPLQRNIDAITIASEGNAIDFGTLIDKTRDYNGAQNMVRGLIAGGSDPSDYQSVISAISLTTSGFSENFGDLMKISKSLAGLSGSHGGLGGF